ncbi:MAG: hypothetical protein ACK4L4_01880 [Gemmobacter sp.]
MNEIEPPKDERPFGEAKFNYESHDGRFIIGAGSWMFETSWTGAGHGSAHLYNDPVGIEGVAIAESVTRISQVTPEVVAAADFTSRTRTPRVGQIALLRNTVGFYAAVELLDVRYSDMPSANVIRLRFAICTDGATDFSPFSSIFNDRHALVEQLLAACSDAESALHAVPIGGNIGEAESIGIGHNQPPAEFAITKDDRTETLGAIASVKQEALSVAPSTSRLRAAGQTIARVVVKVAKWIGAKAEAAADEFSKMLGKAAGVTFVGSAACLALQDSLTKLIEMLRSFIG